MKHSTKIFTEAMSQAMEYITEEENDTSAELYRNYNAERAEGYIRAEEYNTMPERSENNTRKRRRNRYRGGGRKRGQVVNSYQRNWGPGY